MSVIEAAKAILALRRSSTSQAELDDLVGAFLSAIRDEDDAGQLRRALDEDAERLLLPPEAKSAAYERLLELDGRDPATLREYAWHLRIYGPDWDEEADALEAEAERVES